MTTKDRPSPQISRGTVKSLAKLDLAICFFGDQDDVSNFYWNGGQAGTLSASRAMSPKAVVH